jgi:hypothetical protein
MSGAMSGSDSQPEEGDGRWERYCEGFDKSEGFDKLKDDICAALTARDSAFTYSVIGIDDAVRLTAQALGLEDYDITDFMLFKRLVSIFLVARNAYELFLNPGEIPEGVAILAGLASLPSDCDRCALLQVSQCGINKSAPLSYSYLSQVSRSGGLGDKRQ